MKKTSPSGKADNKTKEGYNEKNPSQPEGAFKPASNEQPSPKSGIKSNTADKKRKEDQQ